MTPRVGISFDPNELRAFEDRIRDALRALGDQKVNRTLATFIERENERLALAGLDKDEKPLRIWRTRSGDSDYHGENYASWTNSTVLVPFGKRSRRVDAFLVKWERDRVLGFGVGRTTYFIGFTSRAGLVPTYWQRQGRNVLGMSPRQRRGTELLLHQHTSAAHGLLKKGGRAVARATNLLGF